MAKSHTEGKSPDDFLTLGQVAKEWGVSARTIYRYVQDGKIKAVRLPGGHARIRRSDADAALRDAHAKKAS